MPHSRLLRFEATMAQLDAQLAAAASLRASNMDRLRTLTAQLDVAYSEPSRSPAPLTGRPSTPEPTPTTSAEPDAYDILPKRTTHGGPYGRSILDRVLASYLE